MARSSNERLSVDCRPVRELGNSVGQTFDKDAMRDLGVLNDEGELVDGVEAKQTIYEDGRVEIRIDIDD